MKRPFLLFLTLLLISCGGNGAPVGQTAVSTPTPPPLTGGPIYTIDPTQSEARFLIDEVLRGQETTVVGLTRTMSGELAFNLENPADAQVGLIRINARDLFTDNELRNRAIARQILVTSLYEWITFQPTELVGLPKTVAIGETVEFEIVGDLTITNQTREVAFETAVTIESASRVSGTAVAEIQYADFGLVIPLAQAVSAVAETVQLQFEFIANR